MPPVVDAEELQAADHRGGGPPDIGPEDHGGGGGDDGDHQGGGRERYIPGAGLLAMRCVLVSITMLFITIATAYIGRSQTGSNWQHIHVPPLLWLSTSLILISSWTLETARGALERRNSRRYGWWLQATVAIGLLFLASQIFALRELVEQGIYLRHNPHSSFFYVITGAHGIHLLGGMAALSYLLIRVITRPEVLLFDFRRQRGRAAVSALYWHFLTLLWLGLFSFLLAWP